MGNSKGSSDTGNGRTRGATDHRWCVYILQCADGALYTGMTSNLRRRYQEHLSSTSHYTGYNPPRRIAYTEYVRTRPDAARRERQLKGWTRRKKLALIAGDLGLLKRL